jgi:hypothetical protein
MDPGCTSVHIERGEMKGPISVAASVVVLVLAAASGALAGEVKGPPGTPCGGDTGVTCVHSTSTTAGPDHANSFCVFSGLNDMDPATGQTSKITQTPADGPAGAPGHGFEVAPGVIISCKGGGNLERGSGG